MEVLEEPEELMPAAVVQALMQSAELVEVLVAAAVEEEALLLVVMEALEPAAAGALPREAEVLEEDLEVTQRLAAAAAAQR